MRVPAALLLLLGCSRPTPPPPSADQAAPPRAPTVDSLVLTLPDSMAVWLVTGRQGVAASGATCDEWSIRIGRRESRHLVPLLYTRHAPRLVRGQVLAIQSNHCVDGDVYMIEPATGAPFLRQPVR